MIVVFVVVIVIYIIIWPLSCVYGLISKWYLIQAEHAMGPNFCVHTRVSIFIAIELSTHHRLLANVNENLFIAFGSRQRFGHAEFSSRQLRTSTNLRGK